MDDSLREALVAYLDGELEPEERAALERRLRDDSACAAELAALRETHALLDLLPGPRRDVDLTERVLSRARRSGRLLRLRAAAALAASLLILAGIVMALRSRPPAPEPPPPEQVELAIRNLHTLEYLALLEQGGEDVDALLEDADLLLNLSDDEVEVE